MKFSELTVVAWKCMLIACLSLAYGVPSVAQTASGSPPKQVDRKTDSAQAQRERGIARCRENRGVDCDKPEGQKEWIQQERPITDEERQRAAAARRAREGSKKI